MAIPRIIDANANRAREALRTLEDVARFGLDDAQVCGLAKSLRHDLTHALSLLPIDRVQLLASRDTEADVGTSISGRGEYQRPDLAAVVAAAASRLTESLRTLEESAKLLGAEPAARLLEACRYRAYTLDKRLTLALGAGSARQFRLCVLLTESLCTHHHWTDIAAAAVRGGADCLQLREKNLPDAELLRRARTLAALCREAGVTAIINDRPDIALAAGAHGVHLGQTDLPVSEVRKVVGARLIVGVSTENPRQASAAFAAGADYCGVGPMFPTTTKHKDHLAGPAYLREYLALPGARPHLAIGGITPDNAAELARNGCRGVAVSSCVCSSPDPADVCQALTAALTPFPDPHAQPQSAQTS